MDNLQEALDIARPHLPTLSLYISIILSAIFPIYTGAHASLSRPVSAAPPKKEKNNELGELGDDEEEETLQPMEALTASDAIMFPVMAACVLATLYWLIERYGAEIINLIMSWYLAGAGVFSVVKLLSDGADMVLGFPFPAVYGFEGKLWTIDRTTEQPCFKDRQGKDDTKRLSPFPGLLGALPTPRFVLRIAWYIRSLLTQKYASEVFVKEIIHVKRKITAINAVAAILGITAVVYSNFVHNYWWLTNLQGFAVSYFALQMLSPTSFAIGSLVLSGLFFYDIWAVFFTPLMVTVATKLDQPIKLLFPRHDLAEEEKAIQYSMLGLGDIVLPGLMVGLCLRYDFYMFWLRQQTKQTKSSKADSEIIKAPYTSPRGTWASRYWTSGLPKQMLPPILRNAAFPRPYFYTALLGYIIGLSATLGVVAVYDHAQPALLYLVPSILVCVWGNGLVRGELKQMWEYSEALTGDAIEQEPSKSDRESAEETSWWRSLLGLSSDDSANKLDNSAKKVDGPSIGPVDGTSSNELQEKAAQPHPDTVITINVRKIPLRVVHPLEGDQAKSQLSKRMPAAEGSST